MKKITFSCPIRRAIQNIPKKTLLLRLFLLILYAALLLVLFINGRSHTVLIDNKADPNGEWQAVRSMSVSINGGEPSEYQRGDRDQVRVKGQKMQISIEFFDGSEALSKTIKLPFMEDTLLLSIPKLIATRSDALEPFNMYAENKAQTESETAERFGQ